MNENMLTDISNDMCTLSKLKVLLLSNNRITCVQNLHFCLNLVHLDLSRNKLTGACSEGLECLVNLELLDLSGNKLTEIGNLVHMNALEELNVSNNHLTSLDGILPVNLVVC
jgi:Leucine-rich repeat (LRR) protein